MAVGVPESRRSTRPNTRVNRWAIFWWCAGVFIGPIALLTTSPIVDGWVAWCVAMLFSSQFVIGLFVVAITRGRYGPFRIELPVTTVIDYWLSSRSTSRRRHS